MLLNGEKTIGFDFLPVLVNWQFTAIRNGVCASGWYVMMLGNLTLYVPCIMFQCADKPTRCNTSYE